MSDNPFLKFVMGLASPGVPAELWEQLRPWMQRFASQAPTKAQLRDPQWCQHVSRNGNECEHMGVVECRACDELVCLEHGYLSRDFLSVCVTCVGAFVRAAREGERTQGKKKKKKKRKQRARQWQPEEEDAEEEELDERHEALEVLGLKDTADLGEIQARFRELSLRHHPDRFPDAKEKAAAEAKFKRLSAAYSTLVAWERKHAA